MHREIGSEFNLSLKENKIVNKNSTNIQEPYHDCMYARSGREAIGFILDEIETVTKTALVPTYICKSMLEPFLKRGYLIEYFSIDECFNPNIMELEDALRKKPDVILVIDWFGMDKNQKVVSLAKKHSKNLTVLADCTHNYFSDFINIEADFLIASLRKWFALPDGAIAINCKGNFNNRLKFINNCFFTKRKEAMLLKTKYLNSGEKSLKTQYRKLLLEAENSLDNEDNLVGISSFSLSLIRQMNFNLMKKKRQDNFNTLFRLFKSSHNNYVAPIINRPILGSECPFSFPIIVKDDRDKLQLWLSSNGIYCPVLWPLPEGIYSNYKTSAYLSDHMLSIPCDQRYSEDDMNYIVDTIDKFFRRN